MKVLLTEAIDKLGIVGDVVEVKPGYARNYLMPRGLALPVTPHNVSLMERRKVKYLKELETMREKALGQKETLEALELEFERKAGENGVLFGSVTTSDIEAYLLEKGHDVDRKRFHLPEAIKKVGEFTCLFKLHPEVTAELRVVVKPEGDLEPVAVEEVAAETVEPEAEIPAPPADDAGEEPETDTEEVTGE